MDAILPLLAKIPAGLASLAGGIRGYLLAAAVAGALAGYGGYRLAWRLQDAAIADLKVADAKAQVAAVVAAQSAERKQAALTQAAGQAAETHQAAVQAAAQVIEKKVPVYVTVQADAKCVLPVGAFRLLDGAAAGVDPDSLASVDAPGEPNDAPSGVDCSRFVALVAKDFAQYRSVAQQLNDVLDLADKQSAAAPAAP
ncbi:MAG TPA: hypothetical protein VJP88_08550 [Caulobacteraceae bacterium]|nr:hypothetical protein [Caulobacteraceae bacterium]